MLVIRILNCNHNKKGITTNDNEIKTIQHADDLSIALIDKMSMKNVSEVLNDFCKHAGSKINISKTECILLRTLRNLYDKLYSIKSTNKAVRFSGIFICHDKIKCYYTCNNKNWMKINHDIRFESWKRSKLTVLVNSAQSTHLLYLNLDTLLQFLVLLKMTLENNSTLKQ